MTPVLQISGLNKRFGGIVVADGIELSLPAGRIVGLIGPNGAGKSSLFNLITGVVTPDAGTIALNGQRLNGLSVAMRARAGLSRTWQHIKLFPSLTVLDNLLVAPRRYPDETPLGFLSRNHAAARQAVLERARACLATVRMSDAADRLPTELSYGKQKLVALARSLMNDGNCLLLDEPMAGVEGPAYEAIQEVVRGEAQRGRAVCVVEHNISFVRDLCDEAVFMFNGRIVSRGSVDELVRDPELTELYFGT